MTARAIGVFALVLAMASPALAQPANSVIGGKKLENDMVHSAAVGYPSTYYEWWNKGKKNLDWALIGELVYGDFTAAGNKGRLIRIGLGVDGVLRWHLVKKEKTKVTNDVALLVKPGVLIGSTTAKNFSFGIRGEVGSPVTIDFHEKFSLVTGGFVPVTWFINANQSDVGWIPLLVRLGIEIDTPKNLAPYFFFDLGPGIAFGGGNSDVRFAWRIGAGTTFWGIRGRDQKGKDVTVEREEIGPVMRETEPAPE
jgi:hypothetical protein